MTSFLVIPSPEKSLLIPRPSNTVPVAILAATADILDWCISLGKQTQRNTNTRGKRNPTGSSISGVLSAVTCKLRKTSRLEITDPKTKSNFWQNLNNLLHEFENHTFTKKQCSIDFVLFYKIGSENIFFKRKRTFIKQG